MTVNIRSSKILVKLRNGGVASCLKINLYDSRALEIAAMSGVGLLVDRYGACAEGLICDRKTDTCGQGTGMMICNRKTFAIFKPEDVHKPCIAFGVPKQGRKVVIKVQV